MTGFIVCTHQIYCEVGNNTMRRGMHGRVEKCIQGFDGETTLVYATWYTWMWMERQY